MGAGEAAGGDGVSDGLAPGFRTPDVTKVIASSADAHGVERRPGVYLWHAADGGMLYVGTALCLRTRSGQHLSSYGKLTPYLASRGPFTLELWHVGNEDRWAFERALWEATRPPLNGKLPPGVCATPIYARPTLPTAHYAEESATLTLYEWNGLGRTLQAMIPRPAK